MTLIAHQEPRVYILDIWPPTVRNTYSPITCLGILVKKNQGVEPIDLPTKTTQNPSVIE